MAKRRVKIEDEVGGGLVDNPPAVPTEPARLLRQNPHSTDYREIRASFDDEGVPKNVTDPAAIAEAGEESAYTDRQGQAVPGEPEAVSREAQEEITRQAREKKERVVMSPLYEIDQRLEKLEATGNYAPGKIRFIRKLLNQLGEDAMRTAVDE
ncbi:MAG TPA: hypothetical protein VN752_05630 [Solirubrobacterales bacterium]|nr:hypothetical protein [Solirubrobacterales bacterium]